MHKYHHTCFSFHWKMPGNAITNYCRGFNFWVWTLNTCCSYTKQIHTYTSLTHWFLYLIRSNHRYGRVRASQNKPFCFPGMAKFLSRRFDCILNLNLCFCSFPKINAIKKSHVKSAKMRGPHVPVAGAVEPGRGCADADGSLSWQPKHRKKKDYKRKTSRIRI